jgi:hypothetical protein
MTRKHFDNVTGGQPPLSTTNLLLRLAVVGGIAVSFLCAGGWLTPHSLKGPPRDYGMPPACTFAVMNSTMG